MPLMAFPLGRVADVVGVHELLAVQGIIVVGALVLVAIVNPSPGRVPPRAYPVGMGMGPGMARPGMRPPVAVEEEAAAAPAGSRHSPRGSHKIENGEAIGLPVLHVTPVRDQERAPVPCAVAFTRMTMFPSGWRFSYISWWHSPFR